MPMPGDDYYENQYKVNEYDDYKDTEEWKPFADAVVHSCPGTRGSPVTFVASSSRLMTPNEHCTSITVLSFTVVLYTPSFFIRIPQIGSAS